MAKRRKSAPQRSHVYQSGEVRPGFSRRQEPGSEKAGTRWTWIVVGVLGVLAVLAVLAYALGFIPGGPAPSQSPSPGPTAATRPSFNVAPPSATPLASPLAAAAGDGTQATIETELGTIVFELYNQSAPVAAENFTNLAEAGFYDGVVFHRTIPGFMIQGGDPEGTGGGGPGYTIPDEPFSGEYTRGVVAMARTEQPNSQGSQFFIVVDDSDFLAGQGYTIFGRVLSGMEVADEIVSGPTTGAQNDIAIDPVVMTNVTIQRP